MILPVLIIFIIFVIYTLFNNTLHNKKQSDAVQGCPNAQPKTVTECLTNPTSAFAKSQKKLKEEHHQTGDSDYHEYMINTGLESSVIDSHRVFTDDIQNVTTGASVETVLSHNDELVPTWGLRRHSAYIPISASARDVPSQTDAQMKDNTSQFKFGLF